METHSEPCKGGDEDYSIWLRYCEGDVPRSEKASFEFVEEDDRLSRKTEIVFCGKGKSLGIQTQEP